MKLRHVCAAALVAAALFIIGVPASAAGLRAVSFATASTGWVAGDGVIYATSDGGRTWRAQYSGRVQFSALHFIDAHTGWAAGVDPIPGAGVLMGTRDGGHTWAKLAEPRSPARSISFADALNGFAVAGGSPLQAWAATERSPAFFGGRLARTTDGARSWNVLDNPMLVDTACASSAQRIWAAYQAAVLRSDDGDSFSNVFSPHVDTKLVWYASVRCAGVDAAWVQFSSTPVGDERPYIVYRTTDGGVHWQPMLMNKKTPDAYPQYGEHSADAPGPWPGPFAAVDASTAFFLGACRQCGAHGAVSITGTADGGATWQPVATIPDVTLLGSVAIAFPDSLHGWVVGAGGQNEPVIEATADGGLTWTRQAIK